MERVKRALRRRWEVEAYRLDNGQRINPGRVPFATFWLKSNAEMEAVVMNRLAANMGSKHAYRVVRLP